MPQDSNSCQIPNYNDWRISGEKSPKLRSASQNPLCVKKDHQDAKKSYAKEKDWKNKKYSGKGKHKA